MTPVQIRADLRFDTPNEVQKWILARCQQTVGTWIGGWMDARDLAQDVWIELLELPAEKRISRAFVCQVIDHRYADRVRHHQLVKRREERVLTALYAAVAAAGDRQAQELVRELPGLLTSLRARLAPETMQILSLRLQGFSYQEVATLVGTSIATAHRRAQEAEALLRRLALGTDPDDDDPSNGPRPPRGASSAARSPLSGQATTPPAGPRRSRGELASLLLHRLALATVRNWTAMSDSEETYPSPDWVVVGAWYGTYDPIHAVDETAACVCDPIHAVDETAACGCDPIHADGETGVCGCDPIRAVDETAACGCVGPCEDLTDWEDDDMLLDNISGAELWSEDQRFIRFFSLTHLWNAGCCDDQLDAYRHAMSKLVDNLSNNDQITAPAAECTIFRIDLRDYGWDDDLWALGALQTLTGGKVPVIWDDWFFTDISEAPLYDFVLYERILKANHDMLSPQTPQTRIQLEAVLGSDVQLDINDELANDDDGTSVGFQFTDISEQNRVIGRNQFPDTFSRAYWTSDESDDALVEGPLGVFAPEVIEWIQRVYPLNQEFKAAVQHSGDLFMSQLAGTDGPQDKYKRPNKTNVLRENTSRTAFLRLLHELFDEPELRAWLRAGMGSIQVRPRVQSEEKREKNLGPGVIEAGRHAHLLKENFRRKHARRAHCASPPWPSRLRPTLRASSTSGTARRSRGLLTWPQITEVHEAILRPLHRQRV